MKWLPIDSKGWYDLHGSPKHDGWILSMRHEALDSNVWRILIPSIPYESPYYNKVSELETIIADTLDDAKKQAEEAVVIWILEGWLE